MQKDDTMGDYHEIIAEIVDKTFGFISRTNTEPTTAILGWNELRILRDGFIRSTPFALDDELNAERVRSAPMAVNGLEIELRGKSGIAVE